MQYYLGDTMCYPNFVVIAVAIVGKMYIQL